MSTTTFSYASNVYPQNVFVEKSEQNLIGIPSPVLFEAMTQSDRGIHCLNMTWGGGGCVGGGGGGGGGECLVSARPTTQ